MNLGLRSALVFTRLISLRQILSILIKMATSTFTVTRDNTSSLSSPLTVNLIVGGAATFGVDYTVSGAATFTTTTASVVIPAGALNATIVVTTVPDFVFETDEALILSIVPSAGVLQAGVNPAATLTILNDDISLDPLFANVRFLMLPVGADNSTAFVDISTYARSVTTVGDTKIIGNKAVFDGIGDRLIISSSPSLAMGSSNFCIETEIETFQTTTSATFISRVNTGFGAGSWTFLISLTGKLLVYFADFSTSTPMLTSITNINDGILRHVAWDRNGNNHRLFIAGILEASVISSVAMPDAATPLCIGDDIIFNGRNYNGKNKAVRITAASRYTSNFNLPIIYS
jgi:Concanavalin A-like lectin/glucanases superfamily